MPCPVVPPRGHLHNCFGPCRQLSYTMTPVALTPGRDTCRCSLRALEGNTEANDQNDVSQSHRSGGESLQAQRRMNEEQALQAVCWP